MGIFYRRIPDYLDVNDLGQPNITTREAAYEQFRTPSLPDEAAFIITRHNRNGLYFSAEAIDDLFDKQVGFVAARLMNFHDVNGKPPHTLKVTMKIEME